jgi:hypothetical protein
MRPFKKTWENNNHFVYFAKNHIISEYQGNYLCSLAHVSSKSIASYKTPAEPLKVPEPSGLLSTVCHS